MVCGGPCRKTLHGWEEYQLLPIYPNKTGLFHT